MSGIILNKYNSQSKWLSEVTTTRAMLTSELKDQISSELNLTLDEFYITNNGKIVTANELPAQFTMSIIIRLLGGKGGFGSMLRAIGAQIEKTTNREACRDLSGRRLRDINEEKRLKTWIASQTDREQEAQDKKQKKLERLLEVPKHKFNDAEYEKVREELTEKVSDAVEQGFRSSASTSAAVGVKRKCDKDNGKSKKSKLWVDADLSDLSDDSSEDEATNGETVKAICA